MDKIEDEELGTCAGIEICQDADNVDQKVKYFSKFHKTPNLLCETYL